MLMIMTNTYLVSTKQILLQYKNLGEKTFLQVPDEALFYMFNDMSNSIAIIVKHLWGNMLSRWTDFLTTDGEKEWRQRDAEFDNDIRDRSELIAKWEEGWRCLFNALDNLTDTDLEREVFIRHESHTVLDAIQRQLAHYAYHIGQIVYLGKMAQGDDWISLSIPKKKA
jgi:hypothetical protein